MPRAKGKPPGTLRYNISSASTHIGPCAAHTRIPLLHVNYTMRIRRLMSDLAVQFKPLKLATEKIASFLSQRASVEILDRNDHAPLLGTPA